MDLEDWRETEDFESIRHRFVTGQNAGGKSDDEVYGDFEDLETGEKFDPGNEENDKDADLENEERRLKKLAKRADFDSKFNGSGALDDENNDKDKSKPNQDQGEFYEKVRIYLYFEWFTCTSD